METDTPLTSAEIDEDAVLEPNGMTTRRLREVMAYIEKNSKDPEYLDRLERTYAAAAELRRERNAEELRWLDEAQGK